MPVTVVQPGFVNGGPEIFENLCMKTAFSCTLKIPLLGGTSMLCEMAYTNPLLPPVLNLFYSNQPGGGGAWTLEILAMPVTVVQPGFVNGGPKRGSETTERGEEDF